MAKILGKEEALFVMTGTTGNLLCILRFIFFNNWFPETNRLWKFWLKIFYSSLCGRGEEVICGHMSHISKYEQGNISQFGGVPFRTIPNELDGRLDIKNIQSQGYFSNDDFHSSQTKGFIYSRFPYSLDVSDLPGMVLDSMIPWTLSIVIFIWLFSDISWKHT